MIEHRVEPERPSYAEAIRKLSAERDEARAALEAAERERDEARKQRSDAVTVAARAMDAKELVELQNRELRKVLELIAAHFGYGDHFPCGCLDGVKEIARAALSPVQERQSDTCS